MSDAAPTPPQPAGHRFVGHSARFARDPFDFLMDATDECGDVFEVNLLGAGRFVVLANAELLRTALSEEREAFEKSREFRIAFRDGIVSTEGEQWRRQRAVLGEFFGPERIETYTDGMVETIERRIDTWEGGETVAIASQMHDLALEVLFGTIFDRPLALDGDETIRDAADGLNEWFRPSSWVLPEWLPTPARRRFERARETLRGEARRLLEERSGGDGDDLLSKLAASDLDRSEQVDQVVTMVFAGHDTTANALTVALHHLERHADVRERFREELSDVLGGCRPQLSDVPALSVTERVVREAMRLLPPVHMLPRAVREPVAVDGWELEPGTNVLLSIMLTHRDERYYDDPLAFRPARWRDWSGPDFAYAPFGGGPRVCIGQRFSLLEAQLALATIGQRYRLEPLGDLEIRPEMTTRTADDAPARVVER